MTTDETTRALVARRLGRDLAFTPSAFIALAGVWLLITPVVVDHGAYPWWSDIAAGAVLLAVGVTQLVRPHRSTALSAVAAAAGGWLIMAAFVLDFHSEVGVWWNDKIVGALVLLMAVVNSLDAIVPSLRKARRPD